MTSDNAREELARLIASQRRLHVPDTFPEGWEQSSRNACLREADAILAAGYEKRTPAGEGAGVAVEQDLRRRAEDARRGEASAIALGSLYGEGFAVGVRIGYENSADAIRDATRASHAPAADTSGVE